MAGATFTVRVALLLVAKPATFAGHYGNNRGIGRLDIVAM